MVERFKFSTGSKYTNRPFAFATLAAMSAARCRDAEKRR
jgi:hypothetical protein